MGDVFGLLTVIESKGSVHYSGKPRKLWGCLCECGNTLYLMSDQLKVKKERPHSCGCHSIYKLAESRRSAPATHQSISSNQSISSTSKEGS